MASKYDPLSKHLESLDVSAWQTNFREIERILGFSLRPSARNHRSWWHNNIIGHPQAHAWMDIGWKTTDVDMSAETLVFRRVSMSAPGTSTAEANRVPESVSQENTPMNPPPKSGVLTDQSEMLFDIHHLMQGLSQARPIFHSEADLQHALAWYIHELMPDRKVRLEYPFPVSDKELYLDIWFQTEKVAIELKFPTRNLEFEWDSERFFLREHGAQPPRRYDFLKDVQRVEQMIMDGAAKAGYAILLTNHPHYWNPPSRQDIIDAAFRIHEGRRVAGELMWSGRAGAETKRGREELIDITGSYDLHWRDYSRLGGSNNQQFRYLAVAVQ